MAEFAMMQKLLWLTMCIPLIDLALLFRKNKQKLATSRLGSQKDLGKLLGNDGLIVSKNFQLSFKKTLEGVVVIAPTGEGKTTSIFLPNLLSNDLPRGSKVVSDPKGEQFALTSEYQRSIGIEPILFEPLGNNAHYNPLDHCKDLTEVRELASNLVQNGDLAIQLASGRGGGEATWINSAIPLLTAVLLMCKTISGAMKILINTPSLELPEMFKNCSNPDALEQFNIFISSAGSPKTASSTVSTLLTALQLFTDHDLINSTYKSDFAPSDLRDKPICLYIKYDVSKSNYLSPFLSIFFNQLIDKIMYAKGLPVLFMLDEFANIGRLNNFSQVVSVGRSEKLGFMICLQNLTQLTSVYGESNATTILNNLKTKCILPSISDYKALNYISNLCGDKEVDTESINDKGKSHSKTTKKLFTADEIRRIDDDGILVIAHNKLPFMDEQNTYYNQSKYTNNVMEKFIPLIIQHQKKLT